MFLGRLALDLQNRPNAAARGRGRGRGGWLGRWHMTDDRRGSRHLPPGAATRHLKRVIGRDVIAITSVGLRRLEGRAGCPVMNTPIGERTRRSRAPTRCPYFASAVLIDFTTALPRTAEPSVLKWTSFGFCSLAISGVTAALRSSMATPLSFMTLRAISL